MKNIYAVFGSPIEHSLSPLIHQHFAKQINKEIDYKKILALDFAKQLGEFFQQENAKGCNITVPFKNEAFALVDVLSENAKFAGAINTIKKRVDGKLFGENTDGLGLIADFKRLDIDLQDKQVLVIGAGGATKGILANLLQEKAKITITNRTIAKANELAKHFQSLGSINALNMQDLHQAFDLVINATSASITGEIPQINKQAINTNSICYDLMYVKNGETAFNEFAKSLGARTYQGLGMLVLQAKFAFELWEEREVDANLTLQYLENYLANV